MTLVNTLGLTVAYLVVLAAFLFAIDELNFDKFHPESNRLYRLVVDWNGDGITRNWARSSMPLGNVANDALPEIQQMVRIRKNPGTELITIAGESFYEGGLLLAEPDFFEMFGFELLRGEIDQVLAEKYSIVLTEQMANKYFGTADAIGQIIRYDNHYDLKVTGIARDAPSNSHIQFDGLISFLLLEEMFNERRRTHWGQFDHYTYLKLTAGAEAATTETKMAEYFSSNAPDWVNEKMSMKLQPVTDIHLNSNRHSELSTNSDPSYLRIFMATSVLILLVAIINYMNLTLATHFFRLKEMMVKKVLGSSHRQLVLQVIAESIMLSVLAAVLALGVLRLILPFLEEISGKGFEAVDWISLILTVLGMSVALGALAGLFPATNLPGFVSYRQGYRVQNKSRTSNLLILVQMVVSAFLIACTLGVLKQTNYMQRVELGFENKGVISIPVKDRSKNKDYQTIVNRLKSIPGIKNASFSSSTPGSNNHLTYTYKISGADRPEAAMATVLIDENFAELYGLELLRGRLPDGNGPKEQTQIILNQAAVEMFEIGEAIGKTVSGKTTGTIIGVVGDFQVSSLHSPTEPVIMFNYLPTLRYVSIEPEAQFTKASLESLAVLWSEFYPNYPLEYTFLSDENKRLYRFEDDVLLSMKLLTSVALLIATVGLIAHLVLLMYRKAKEFSIRKVLGASVKTVFFHSLVGSIRFLILGMLVAIAGSVWALETWQQQFAFKSSIGIETYIIPIMGVALILVLVTLGLLSKQLRENPVNNLRNE